MSLGKSLKSVTKSVSKVFDGDTLTTMGLYAAGAALMATGYGAGAGATMWAAAAGAGYGAAQGGAFGTGVQDLATFGASAQQRAAARMASVYNQAQAEQAKIREEQNRQNLLQQIRAARIARAMNLADYAGEEGVTTSGALGNLSSVGSQYLSNLGYSVRTGQAANAYQTYMNQYNAYQAQAQSNALKWQNRMNTINTALSLYGMGQGLQTQGLQNYYAGLRLADATAQASQEQQVASSVPSWEGKYLSYGVSR